MEQFNSETLCYQISDFFPTPSSREVLHPVLSSAVRWKKESIVLPLHCFHREGTKGWKGTQETRPQGATRHLENSRCPLSCFCLCCQRVHPSVSTGICPRAHLAQSWVVFFEKNCLDTAAHAGCRYFWEDMSPFCPSPVQSKGFQGHEGPNSLAHFLKDRAEYWFCTGFSLSQTSQI